MRVPIYIIKGRIHMKKNGKIDHFYEKTLKKTVVLRDFHVTETYCHIIVT